MTVSPELLDLLACPVCRGPLEAPAGESPLLVCAACGSRYPLHLDIPLLVPPLAGEESAHERRQIEFFDQPSVDDFGVTRPRGAPELYG